MSFPTTLSERMGDLVRRILTCCDGDYDHSKTTLQISGPTDFRREDISIPGLSEEQQQFIREKAKVDAARMWETLQPLRSLPSGTFAERPAEVWPTYEEFTTPRPISTVPSPTSRLDRMRAHSRKFSDALAKPVNGYQVIGKGDRHSGDSLYEMRALVNEDSRVVVSS